MQQDYFEPPLFIKEGKSTTVNLSKTPFFCNIGGRPVYVKKLPAGAELLKPKDRDTEAVKGKEYQVKAKRTEMPSPEYGEQTRLKFAANKVAYQPMWATRKAAAAFGMTLVEEGQGIRVSKRVKRLEQVDYEYGMFAGHQSPYQGTGPRLLGTVCTDLECHDFPHIFASIDLDLPLVISVGRYWPKLNKIYLADLWLPRGKALYVPPRPRLEGQEYLDLHGNRNSALACWQGIEHTSVRTRTLLQTEGGYFHWFWNELPTIHPLLK